MWRERPLASDDATGATAVWPLAIVRKRGCMTVQSAIRRALRSVWERESGAIPPKWMEMRAASAQMHAGDECNAFLYLSATRCWMCARWYAESDRCVINQRRDAMVFVYVCAVPASPPACARESSEGSYRSRYGCAAYVPPLTE